MSPLNFWSLILLVLLYSCSSSYGARSCISNPISTTSIRSGFCAFEYARVVGARGIDVAPNGDLLVLSRSNPSQIVALYEEVGTSESQTRSVVLASLTGLNHAIRYHNGYIYASTPTTVYRWPYTTMRQSLSNRETVVSGMPAGGHATRTLEFSSYSSGQPYWMYISIGSYTNLDADSSRSRVVRVNLNDSMPIAYSNAELFADGVRNEVGIRLDPQNRLWGVENGMDNLDRFTTNPPLYITNPAEKVNIFTQENTGKFYGYPYCWSEGIGEYGQTLSFPNGLGNGTTWAVSGTSTTYTDTWCRANSIPPVWAMQAHSAPLDIMFDTSGFFDDFEHGVAVIPKHGSWNRPADKRAGFSVDILSLDNSFNPQNIFNLVTFPLGGSIRPVAAARASCVAYGECLFITDDSSGTVIALAKTSSYAPGTLHSPVPANQPNSDNGKLIINEHLTVSYRIQSKGMKAWTLITEVVNTGSYGWFSFGWNKEPRMSGTTLLVLNGSTCGYVDVTERDPELILNTWNDPQYNWGYYDQTWNIVKDPSDPEKHAQTLSFKRDIECSSGTAESCFKIGLDGKTGTFAVFAWSNEEYGSLEEGKLPRHDGALTYRVDFVDPNKGKTMKASIIFSVLSVLLCFLIR